jgi:hypothetical protein
MNILGFFFFFSFLYSFDVGNIFSLLLYLVLVGWMMERWMER